MRTAPAVVFATLALVSLPPALHAQATWRSEATGFHVAAYGNGSAIVYEDQSDAETGSGAGIALGYGLSQLVTLYAEVTGASVDMLALNASYTLAHVDLGARFNFGGRGSRLRPYAQAALTGVGAGLDIAGDAFTITGSGLTVGGGVAFFLLRQLALDAGVKWTFGSFDQAEYRGAKQDIDVSATSSRFNIGVAWWMGR